MATTRVLVLANRTVDYDDLRRALVERNAQSPIEVTLLVPAAWEVRTPTAAPSGARACAVAAPLRDSAFRPARSRPDRPGAHRLGSRATTVIVSTLPTSPLVADGPVPPRAQVDDAPVTARGRRRARRPRSGSNDHVPAAR